MNGLPHFGHINYDHVCAACQFGKQTRLPFPKRGRVTYNPLEIVHADVWGPCQNTSIGGCQYYITFIDNFTRMTWVYFMKHKSEALEKFIEFKQLAEKEFNSYIKCLRSDSGGEYLSLAFDNYLQQNGIQRQLTCSYTPQQNGVAERKNRIIAEIARAFMN